MAEHGQPAPRAPGSGDEESDVDFAGSSDSEGESSHSGAATGGDSSASGSELGSGGGSSSECCEPRTGGQSGGPGTAGAYVGGGGGGKYASLVRTSRSREKKPKKRVGEQALGHREEAVAPQSSAAQALGTPEKGDTVKEKMVPAEEPSGGGRQRAEADPGTGGEEPGSEVEEGDSKAQLRDKRLGKLSLQTKQKKIRGESAGQAEPQRQPQAQKVSEKAGNDSLQQKQQPPKGGGRSKSLEIIKPKHKLHAHQPEARKSDSRKEGRKTEGKRARGEKEVRVGEVQVSEKKGQRPTETPAQPPAAQRERAAEQAALQKRGPGEGDGGQVEPRGKETLVQSAEKGAGGRQHQKHPPAEAPADTEVVKLQASPLKKRILAGEGSGGGTPGGEGRQQPPQQGEPLQQEAPAPTVSPKSHAAHSVAPLQKRGPGSEVEGGQQQATPKVRGTGVEVRQGGEKRSLDPLGPPAHGEEPSGPLRSREKKRQLEPPSPESQRRLEEKGTPLKKRGLGEEMGEEGRPQDSAPQAVQTPRQQQQRREEARSRSHDRGKTKVGAVSHREKKGGGRRAAREEEERAAAEPLEKGVALTSETEGEKGRREGGAEPQRRKRRRSSLPETVEELQERALKESRAAWLQWLQSQPAELLALQSQEPGEERAPMEVAESVQVGGEAEQAEEVIIVVDDEEVEEGGVPHEKGAPGMVEESMGQSSGAGGEAAAAEKAAAAETVAPDTEAVGAAEVVTAAPAGEVSAPEAAAEAGEGAGAPAEVAAAEEALGMYVSELVMDMSIPRRTVSMQSLVTGTGGVQQEEPAPQQPQQASEQEEAPRRPGMDNLGEAADLPKVWKRVLRALLEKDSWGNPAPVVGLWEHLLAALTFPEGTPLKKDAKPYKCGQQKVLDALTRTREILLEAMTGDYPGGAQKASAQLPRARDLAKRAGTFRRFSDPRVVWPGWLTTAGMQAMVRRLWEASVKKEGTEPPPPLWRDPNNRGLGRVTWGQWCDWLQAAHGVLADREGLEERDQEVRQRQQRARDEQWAYEQRVGVETRRRAEESLAVAEERGRRWSVASSTTASSSGDRSRSGSREDPGRRRGASPAGAPPLFGEHVGGEEQEGEEERMRNWEMDMATEFILEREGGASSHVRTGSWGSPLLFSALAGSEETRTAGGVARATVAAQKERIGRRKEDRHREFQLHRGGLAAGEAVQHRAWAQERDQQRQDTVLVTVMVGEEMVAQQTLDVGPVSPSRQQQQQEGEQMEVQQALTPGQDEGTGPQPPVPLLELDTGGARRQRRRARASVWWM